ncbi:MAG: SPOR domain-containing protein [Saccharospirillaceae bacterium]|nr:SPOR domain-containing protein [Pseudomonadales bacterium]NRB81159.1 SPOR domain-containing protein [Saccharospirillaceae bacterium]
MDAGFRKRLIGATVIVIFAVVVLPQILDGEGRIPERVTNIPIKPEKPDLTSLAQIKPQALNVPDLSIITEGEPIELSEVADDSTRIKQTITQGQTQIKDRTVEFDGDLIKAYAIQVGSFSKEEGAFKLRDQLREKGYHVYTKTGYTKNNKVLIQVLVGPIISKEDAYDESKKLEKEPDVKSPWVMNYQVK